MGSIITFYSYKGGVGRTMALANIAVLLARRGLRVLAVDWDLEAPGLLRYFSESKIQLSNRGGLLELLEAVGSVEDLRAKWSEYATSVTVERNTTLTLLTSGRLDTEYESRVLNFEWPAFFRERKGGEALEMLRDDWRSRFDVTLIDSRTGITDSGGVCTIQMPDILVLVFSANKQSLDGAKQVAIKAQRARQALAYDRTSLLVFPLPSRFDSRTEFRESQRWLKIFAEELGEFYCDWLPKGITALEVLERTKLPYVAYFSFGEKLPVLTEGSTDPESLAFAYTNAASLIASDFKDPAQIVTQPLVRGLKGDVDGGQSFDPREVGQRLDQALSSVELSGKPSFALMAVPVRKVDFPNLVESRDARIVKLIEHPPKLRRSGFDLETGAEPRLVSHGKARRAVVRGYKAIELWRDGCLIFAADGLRFLCRRDEQVPGRALRIHPLVLAESALLFCKLAMQVYAEALPNTRTIEYVIEFRNLTNDGVQPTLLPLEAHSQAWPGERIYEAEYGGERFGIMADLDEQPAVVAWRLVAEVYLWFGIEQSEIPYTIRGDGPPSIDESKIASL